MKKYLSLLGFLTMASLALSASLVQAEDNGEGRTGRPDLFKTFQEDRKEFRTEHSEDRREFFDEMRANRQAFVDKMKTDREAFVKELQARREAWKSASKEDKAKFRGNARIMIGERFSMAIKNLESVQARVGEKIADLKADGENTDDAEDALDLSKTNLTDAKEKVEDIKALIPDTDEKVTPEVFEQIKLLAREAKDLLKESKENLLIAIKEVKELKGADDSDEDED